MKNILVCLLILIINSPITYADEVHKATSSVFRQPEITWKHPPRPYLGNFDHSVLISKQIDIVFDINKMGKPENLRISKSSCNSNIDRETLRSFRSAMINKDALDNLERFKNFVQTIKIHSDKDLMYMNKLGFLNFNSEVWIAQQNELTKEFQYDIKPELNIKPEILEGLTRDIDFEIEIGKKNKISKVTIIKSSGLIALDQAIQSALIDIPVTINPSFRNLLRSTFKDQISFQFNECIKKRLEEA